MTPSAFAGRDLVEGVLELTDHAEFGAVEFSVPFLVGIAEPVGGDFCPGDASSFAPIPSRPGWSLVSPIG